MCMVCVFVGFVVCFAGRLRLRLTPVGSVGSLGSLRCAAPGARRFRLRRALCGRSRSKCVYCNTVNPLPGHPSSFSEQTARILCLVFQNKGPKLDRMPGGEWDSQYCPYRYCKRPGGSTGSSRVEVPNGLTSAGGQMACVYEEQCDTRERVARALGGVRPALPPQL